MSYSKIEWTESSWNPVTGCSKTSPGCFNCYAEKMANRLKSMGQKKYREGFSVVCHDDVLDMPLKWKKPRTIFVNSMSDLFHEEVPFDFITKVFNVMRKAYWHRFQILTKRSRRLVFLSERIKWPDNVWMGVSVENNDYLNRIDDLKRTDAKIKFVSFEPLIGPVSDFDKTKLSSLNWIIVGGESGIGARPISKEWVMSIRDLCLTQEVPFFFKQWGGVYKKKNGRMLDGEYWEQLPDVGKERDEQLVLI